MQNVVSTLEIPHIPPVVPPTPEVLALQLFVLGIIELGHIIPFNSHRAEYQSQGGMQAVGRVLYVKCTCRGKIQKQLRGTTKDDLSLAPFVSNIKSHSGKRRLCMLRVLASTPFNRVHPSPINAPSSESSRVPSFHSLAYYLFIFLRCKFCCYYFKSFWEEIRQQLNR